MAIAPSYPGVYVEELPSGVRTITGVSTSVAALVGYASMGPLNTPTQVFSFGEFERLFGGLERDSEMSYAVRQFFLNGGAEAWIVRVAGATQTASVSLKNFTGSLSQSASVLSVSARNAGSWANGLSIFIDYNTANPDNTFNLRAVQYESVGSSVVVGQTDVYANLSMDSNSSRYVGSVLGASSGEPVVVEVLATADASAIRANSCWSLSGVDLDGGLIPSLDGKKLNVQVDGNSAELVINTSGVSTFAELVTHLNTLPAGTPLDGLVTFDEAFADGTLDNSGTRLIILPTAALTPSSFVKVLPASSDDAAPILKLGTANGGRERGAAADLRPATTGTISSELTTLGLPLSGTGTSEPITVQASDGSNGVINAIPNLGSYTTLETLAALLQTEIRALGGVFATTTVEIASNNRLKLSLPDDASDNVLTLTDGGGGDVHLADELGLSTGAHNAGNSQLNVQRYRLGTGATGGAQVQGTLGLEGQPPSATELVGSESSRTGIYALDDLDGFNLLSIPRTFRMSTGDAETVIATALAYCEKRRAFMIVDAPGSISTVSTIKAWVSGNLSKSRNGAVYFPSLRIPDPLDELRLKDMAASGTLAGLYARTDATRGLWKAPAGTDATLTNVQGLSHVLTDAEIGTLNPIGLNCLRGMPIYGRVSWGARTLKGADIQADEYKYIPVRRLALFIEESLYRGLQWAVFEPNDAPLWSQIRLNANAFMHNLFRKGAFKGGSPREAYFVKCDSETTTQADIDLGIVNVLVGFAPLKPAEFVILHLQQMAGQLEV